MMNEETPVVTEVTEELGKAEVAPQEAELSSLDREGTSPAEGQAETESQSKAAKNTEGKPEKAVAKGRPKVRISLSKGQELQGKVKTITDFGAFIDIDLPLDGLVHISELSRDRIEKVSDVVAVGDEVTVWVKDLDKARNRISLTMNKPVERTFEQVNTDDVLEGQVTRIESYGVFVDVGLEREGLIHVSELSHDYVRVPEDVVSVGETVQVKVLKVNKRRKQLNLSMKALADLPEAEEAEEVEEVVEEAEEVELSTTMAAAFSAFSQTEQPSPRGKKSAARTRRDSSVMDDVISRTLKTQTDQE